MIRTILPLLVFLPFISTGQPLRMMPPIGHTNTIKAFAFSKDGKFLATGGEDKTVNIWDVNTGKILQHFTGLNSEVESIAFHPNSRSVIASVEDGILTEWDIYSGKVLSTITNENEGMAACAFSNDGKFIAIIYSYRRKDPETILYDYEQKKIIKRTVAHKEHVRQMSFTKDDKYLVSISYDNSLKLLDVPTLAEKGKIQFPKSDDIEIKSFSLAPSEKTLVLTHRSKGMMFYSFPALQLQKTFKPERAVYAARYSNDGRMIVTAQSSASFEVWDAVKLTSLNAFKSTDGNEMFGMDNAAFSNDDTKIFTVSTFVGFGKMYDRNSRKLLYNTQGSSASLSSAEFLLGGALIATGTGIFAKIWSGTSGRFLYNIVGHKSVVGDAKFSYKGDFLVTSSWDKTARIWNWTNKKLIQTFNLQGEGDDAELSKDNKKLLTRTFKDSAVYIWNVETGQVLYKLVHPDEVESTCFNFEGTLVATGAKDETVRIWDATTGKLLKELKGHDHFVSGVNFQLNSKLLISSSLDSTAKVWDVATGICIATLKGHTGRVNSAVLSMDNDLALTASDDRTAKLWNIKTGKCLATIEGHSDALISASFSTYDERVMTVSKDNSFKVWDGKTGKLLATSYAIGNNDFFTITPEGYYFCSPAAARMVHYVTPDLKTIPFDQLDLKYNRPDKVMETMGHRNKTLIEAYRNAYRKRIKRSRIDTLVFTQNLSVPVAEITNAASISLQQKNSKLSLKIHAADERTMLSKLNVWVNEVPVFGMNGIDLNARKIRSIDTTITVQLSDSSNIIETSVINMAGTESYRTPSVVNYLPADPSTVKTYFFGVGINNYREKGHDLNWSVKDIRDLAINLRLKYGKSIVIDTLFNENATRSNILAFQKKLSTLTVNDRVIFAFSGHGLLSKNFDYYLSTYTVNFENPDADNEGLLYDDLEKIFDGIASRKKLVLIDACHSGELDKDDITATAATEEELKEKGIKGVTLGTRPSQKAGSANSFEILQQFFANVSRSTGTTVISAAAGTQYALERGDIQNGVFTYCLIEAMKKFPSIQVQYLKRYVTSRVLELTNGLQKPNSRTETNIFDWHVW